MASERVKKLEELMKGLSHNGLDHYSHLLTGYVGDAGFLHTIADVVKQLRNVNPSLMLVCDPVMGDNDRFYVPQELVPIYRNEIIPLANIITPNQFELEMICDRTISSMQDALKTMDYIHNMGVEIVFLTTTTWTGDDKVTAVVSRRNGDERKVLKISVPHIPVNFTGTGDLTSALFLAWYTKTKHLQVSLENVIATLNAVLKRTFQTARQMVEGDNLTVASRELKLIQRKMDIENPTCTFAAEPVEV